MNKTLRNLCVMALTLLCTVPAMAQLNGTGFYRFRNAAYTSDYISIANDKFNFATAIDTACGGLRNALSDAGQQRALDCVARFLQTDIHMVNDSEMIFPSAVIYAQKRNTNPSNYDYNLIGQGTSLLTLATGTYPGSIELEFSDRYITIEQVSGTNTYTAKIELKSSTYVIIYGYPTLGTRYFLDDNSTFAINESSSTDNARWYIEPVDHFNVIPEVEFNGKYYTTLKVPYACKLSGQVLNAYAITAVENGVLSYEVVATNGGTIPAGTPVVLECGSPNAADCQLIPSGRPIFTAPDVSLTTGAPASDESSSYTGTNLLGGTYFCNTDGDMSFPTPSGTSSFNADHSTATTGKYVLGLTESGKLGFVAATGTAMPANKAWLETAAEFPWELPVVSTKGDVNRDGMIDVDDVTALISLVLGNAPADNDYDLDAADFNDSENIDVDDVTALIGFILS